LFENTNKVWLKRDQSRLAVLLQLLKLQKDSIFRYKFDVFKKEAFYQFEHNNKDAYLRKFRAKNKNFHVKLPQNSKK
jgi:hypothetical protein